MSQLALSLLSKVLNRYINSGANLENTKEYERALPEELLRQPLCLQDFMENNLYLIWKRCFRLILETLPLHPVPERLPFRTFCELFKSVHLRF